MRIQTKQRTRAHIAPFDEFSPLFPGSRVDLVSQQKKLYRNEWFLLLRDEPFLDFCHPSVMNDCHNMYIRNKLSLVNPSETLIK